jgi:hypothetical protein
LADTQRLIATSNARQEARTPMLFSPTIRAAIAARRWFLWVRCPACQTVNAISSIVTPMRRSSPHSVAILPLMPAGFASCRIGATVAAEHSR